MKLHDSAYSIAILLTTIVLTGCADASTQNFLGPATAATATSPVVVVDTPSTPTVPTTPTEPEKCRGIHNTIHEATPNGLSIRVKNLCLDGTPKEYVFASFSVAPNGVQTLLQTVEVLLPAGQETVLTLHTPNACKYQTDLFTEITIAQIVSGEAKINPGQEGQPGYVNAIYGKVYGSDCPVVETCDQSSATLRPFVDSYPFPVILYRDIDLRNAGVWSIRLLRGSSVEQYNSNTFDAVMDTRNFNLGCGAFEHTQVTYPWGNYPGNYWWVEVWLNESFYAKGDYTNNITPSFSGGDEPVGTGEVPQGDIPVDKPVDGVR